MVTFKQGDIITINLNPTKGSEQKGRRPALVISNDVHNHMQKMIFVCPITKSERNYPTHVKLNGFTTTINGSIMIEQMRAIDQTNSERDVQKIDEIAPELMKKVTQILNALL